MDEFLAGAEQTEFDKRWKSKNGRADILKWAKTVYKDDGIQFLIDVEDYKADPTWTKLDTIVDTYLKGAIDVTGEKAKRALTLRKSTNRNGPPPGDVFDEGYGWIYGSFPQDSQYKEWESKNKKQ
jgi:hypothetical protein